tara:strand:- start:5299 stop:6513 length:1215 start_codon:yes stop_codon:yes gene_type:complete
MSIPTMFLSKTFMGLAIAFAFFICVFLRGVKPPLSKIKARLPPQLLILLIITLICWLPNIFFSSDPLRSVKVVLRTFGLFVLVCYFWVLMEDRQIIRQAFQRSFVLSVALVSLFACLSKTIHPGLYFILHLEPWQKTPLLTELKPLASLSPILLPILIWLIRSETRVWQVASFLACLLLIVVLVLSGSRASVAGLLGAAALSSVALIICRPSKVRFAFMGFVVTFSMVVMFWLRASWNDQFAFTPMSPEITQLFFPNWLIDFQRQAIWQFALEKWTTAVWFGIGADTINFTGGADRIIPGTNDTRFMPGHPHNWGVEILAETGILGFASYVLLVITMLFHAINRFISTSNSAYLILIAISGGYLCSGLFNFSYWSSWWQFSVLLCGAFALANVDYKDDGHEKLF